MKPLSKLPFLSALCVGLGLICLCVQQWTLISGTDSKGLLAVGHPGKLVSLLLLAATIGILCFALKERQVYRFSPTPLSSVSMIFFAIGYAYTAWQLLRHRAQTLSVLAGILAIASALCALLLAVSLYRKLRLHPFVYCPPVLFFLVFLVCRYQQWSSEPEVLRYLFQLLSVVGLMLTAYHRAALEADKKGILAYLLLSRGAVFCCIAAIPGSLYGVLYGCSAVALLLDGFTVKQGD